MLYNSLIKEVRELSGLSRQDFCRNLNVPLEKLEKLESWETGDNPSPKELVQALAVMVKGRRNMPKVDKVEKQLSQAKAIVVTVQGSDELTEHQQLALSAASDLVDSAAQTILDA